MKEAGAADLRALLAALRHAVLSPARLYLVGATSHLAEGWRMRVASVELAGGAGAAMLEGRVREAAERLGLAVTWESPADVIPLPGHWEERARVLPHDIAGADAALEIRHFDPYSVVLRLVARGDEPDYVTALDYVRRGWVEPARLEALFLDVVPRFTDATLAQDPAEFRRKFSGLRQLYARDAAWRRTSDPALADQRLASL